MKAVNRPTSDEEYQKWTIIVYTKKSINKLERGGFLLVADPRDKNVVETVVLVTSIRSTGEQVVFISAHCQSKMAAIQILARL